MTASTEIPPSPNGTPADEDITVLLVDDNEQWLEVLSSDLEIEAGFETVTALDATEALLQLREQAEIDCVIADYRMPEVDGLQLLERVRDEHPGLPFILLTGMGSEDVATRAIRAGVSDYFRKDPKANEVPILAKRVSQAVDQARLRRELRESEERYRTITEQIAEGIAILQHGEIRYSNDRLVDLTGHPSEELHGASFVELLVSDQERDAVEQTLSAAPEEASFHESQLRHASGKILDIEYAVRQLTHRAPPATMLSIRDITAKKTRERNLEREREITRTVQRVLIESRTRRDLEAEIAELLFGDGYDLVWIGETVGEQIRPTKTAGDTAYLDDLTLSTDAEHSAEPSIWTARTGEPQFPGDFEDMFATHWRDRALEHGFRTGAALPLVYDNVSYGVLGAYHTDPHYIDTQEEQLLTRLSETLAFAIHHIELKKSLSSSDVVEVELLLTDTSYYLAELAADRAFDAQDVTFTVLGTHRYDDDSVLQYIEISAGDLDEFVSLTEDDPCIEEVQVILEGERPRLQLTLGIVPPEIGLTRFGAVVNPTTVTPERAILRFSLHSRGELEQVVEGLEAKHGDVTVRSCVDVERQDSVLDIQPMIQLAELTDKQAAALQAAYHHGYFEQPRQNSAKDIAESLGVVHSTYLQHLRAAQRKLFGALYHQDESPAGAVQ